MTRTMAPEGLRPLQTPVTLHQAAVAQLREAIVSGNLPPGAVLKDAEVAARLGLSATPVREALLQLAAEGLVEIEPNRLKRVTPIDHQAMVELIEVQIQLWALGYAWGAPHVGPQELARLAEANAAHRVAILGKDARGAVVAAQAFHLVLMQASRNRELVRISVDRLPLIQRYVVLCTPEIGTRKMIVHHATMLEGLRRGDVRTTLAAFKTASGVLLAAAEALRDAARKV